MIAKSPTGHRIVGTAEQVPAMCPIDASSFRREPNGSLAFEHSGYDTELYWDGIEPVLVDGRLQFQDEAGELWDETNIVLVDEEDEDDAKPQS